MQSETGKNRFQKAMDGQSMPVSYFEKTATIIVDETKKALTLKKVTQFLKVSGWPEEEYLRVFNEYFTDEWKYPKGNDYCICDQLHMRGFLSKKTSPIMSDNFIFKGFNHYFSNQF